MIKVINSDFKDLISRLVFNVSLPALLFVKLAFVDLKDVFHLDTIIVIYAGTLIGFALSWIFSSAFIPKGQGRGAFIQGSFRGNEAIIGMALIINIYGDQAAAKIATILVFLIPLFNILSIIALTFSDTSARKSAIKKSLKSLLANPLIIAITLSILVSAFSIPIHSIIVSTGKSLAAVALPLALIGIGASLDLKKVLVSSKMAIISSAFKIILMPVIGTTIAWFYGIKGQDLGIIYIVFACPTAIVSFIMADAMGKHGKMAGSIVVISTMASLVTIGGGMYILELFGVLTIP